MSAKTATAVGDKLPDATLAFSPNVLLALARVSEEFFPDSPGHYHFGGDVAATAQIHPSAKIGKGCRIGHNVVIGENVVLGTGVWIGPNSVIEGDITIGDNTNIYPQCFIARRTSIGKSCNIKAGCSIGCPGFGYAHDEKGHHFLVQQLGRVVIEDRVDLGAGSAIDRATFDETRICEGTKFDNLVHIAHNCKIGRNCLLTGSFMTAGSSTLGDNIVTGGRVSVTDHIQICDNVQIGGLSGVSKDVTQPGAYAGYPLLPIKDHLKSTASIPHLPRLRKDISRILKHLGLAQESDGS